MAEGAAVSRFRPDGKATAAAHGSGVAGGAGPRWAGPSHGACAEAARSGGGEGGADVAGAGPCFLEQRRALPDAPLVRRQS